MIVQWLFNKLYGGYAYPFKRSDAKIMEMADAEKKEYYRQAKDLLENRVYMQENEEAVRNFYQELAVKTGSKVEQQAYRLTLMFIQAQDKRVRSLASLYQPPNVNNFTKNL